MKVTDDVDKAAKWEKHRKSLEDRTMQSRSAVSKKIGLTDKDLSNVLPIHPYAALILQHISIYYTSTARSMFNFIKNDEGEDVKAFQWFIDRYDFSSQNPFVTIDMLWNFFYETGSQKLADGIREVLSCYTQKMDKELMEDEKRVLKVILLLQAISERMSGNRDIFLPNNKNLTLAFEGTDLEVTAQNIAKKLLNDHVVTRTPLTGDVFSYCCKNMGPSVDPGPFIAQAKGKSTKDMSFMAGSNLRTTIGKLCLDNDGVVDDLKRILTKDNCKSGMLEYLKLYDGGKLPAVAEKINDGGQYINQLQYKFSSDAANWVWNTDTVNAKIDELICEYEIIEISNGVLSKNATYMEAIRAWVDKIGQIRLAYSMIKNELGDSKAFYEMLYNLYKQRNLLDSQKKPFLDLLRENIENFKYFMGSQSSLFIKACSFYLDDLSEEDVKSILDDDTYGFGGSYLLERDKYTGKVQKAVDLYKNAQLYTQLKKKWNDLTDTDSPYMWSNKYHMPILAMVPDDEIATARKVFGAINSKTKDENTITTALDYLDKMTYVQKLNNKEDRDKAFRDVFLEEFSELFDDVDEVRTYLQNHISDSPYHWLGNKAVTAKIKTMANAKYNESGYGKAKKVIDEMPAEQVKEYLKKMIEDNFVVGLEIIKKQK